MQAVVCIAILITLFWTYVRHMPYAERMSNAFVSIPSFVLTTLIYYVGFSYTSILSTYTSQVADVLRPFFEQSDLGSSIALIGTLLQANVLPFIAIVVEALYTTIVRVVLDPSLFVYECIILGITWIMLFGPTWLRTIKILGLRTYQRIRHVVARRTIKETIPYGYVPKQSGVLHALFNHVRVFVVGMNMSGRAILLRTLVYSITPWALILLAGVLYWMFTSGGV